MFIPTHYKETDVKQIKEFIKKNSFGTIVTTEQGKPIATHIPFMLREIDGDYHLTGHVAYANPQWKTLEANNDNVLVMFQGPHAYVSSSWYKEEDVPTWNYQSVHIYGKAEIMSEEALKEDLILLLDKYEKHRENPISWKNLTSRTLK